MSDARTDTIDHIMRGAVDLHCHSGPSIMGRKLNHLEQIEAAEAAGMRAVLFKDHFFSATPIMNMLTRHRRPGSNLLLLSGVPLNDALGGLNPYAVEHGLKAGARLVWMPTLSAANHLRFAFRYDLAGRLSMIPPSGITAVTEYGVLRDEAKEIIDLIAAKDAVLCGGHLHVSEMFPLFEEAKRRGVRRMLVSHPTYWIDAGIGDLRALTGMGVCLEHCACMVLDGPRRRFTPEELKTYVDVGGVDSTILGSDLGQPHNPMPVEGLKSAIGLCLDAGLTREEIGKLTATNACRLMGIEHG